eukprot:symbB.v1.2.017923.t1/scaffold1406.1/size338231/2
MVKQGEDLTTATWKVESYKQLKCRECSQHDQSQEDCIACAPKCDYGTKELGGLRITGCFDAEKHAFDQKAAEEQAKERLKEATGSAPEGEAAVKKELQDYGAKAVPETEEKQLSIVPHYRIWNPKEHDDLGDLKQPRAESGGYFEGQKLPWETNQRYLSARAWTKEFPHAAPQIQHLLDRVFQVLAGKADLSQIPCDGQGNQSGGLGQLIIGTETAQKSCNDMQQTVGIDNVFYYVFVLFQSYVAQDTCVSVTTLLLTMWALRNLMLLRVCLASEGEIPDLLLNDAEGDCTLNALQVKAKKLDDTSGGYCFGTSQFCATTDKSTCDFWHKQEGCVWNNWAPNNDAHGRCVGEDLLCKNQNDRNTCNFWHSNGCVWRTEEQPQPSVHGTGRCSGTSMFCATTSRGTCEFWKAQGCSWVDGPIWR